MTAETIQLPREALRRAVDGCRAAAAASRQAEEACWHAVDDARAKGIPIAEIASEFARMNSPIETAPVSATARMDIASQIAASTTKKAALKVLFDHRVTPGDSRTINSIAHSLTLELSNYGLTLDRGGANRYVKEFLHS